LVQGGDGSYYGRAGVKGGGRRKGGDYKGRQEVEGGCGKREEGVRKGGERKGGRCNAGDHGGVGEALKLGEGGGGEEGEQGYGM